MYSKGRDDLVVDFTTLTVLGPDVCPRNHAAFVTPSLRMGFIKYTYKVIEGEIS